MRYEERIVTTRTGRLRDRRFAPGAHSLDGRILTERQAAQYCDASAVARELSFVGLAGQALGRDELVAALAAAGASRPGLRIAVEDVAVRELASGLWLATFVERHSPGRSRRTSAILRNEPEAPRGVAWLHAHETPLGWRTPRRKRMTLRLTLSRDARTDAVRAEPMVNRKRTSGGTGGSRRGRAVAEVEHQRP